MLRRRKRYTRANRLSIFFAANLDQGFIATSNHQPAFRRLDDVLHLQRSVGRFLLIMQSISLAELCFGHSYYTVTSLHVLVINIAGTFQKKFRGNLVWCISSHNLPVRHEIEHYTQHFHSEIIRALVRRIEVYSGQVSVVSKVSRNLLCGAPIGAFCNIVRRVSMPKCTFDSSNSYQIGGGR
jgi:hypothetical protein